MNEMEFIGMLVTVGISLIGGLKLVTKPMTSLIERLTNLDDSVKTLNDTLLRQDHRLETHSHRISNLEKTTTEHEVRIQHLEDLKKG